MSDTKVKAHKLIITCWLLSTSYSKQPDLESRKNRCVHCSFAVADLGGGGVPRVPWNPPFGFSDDRKLWKPGL